MRTLQHVAITLSVVLAAAACEGKIVGPGTGDDGGGGDTVDAPLVIDAPGPPPIPADCLEAANRGVVWLAAQQNADGSWGSNQRIASTGFAVLKLETYAWEIGQSAFDPGFIYHTQVMTGLDYLFRNARLVPIRQQTHGNPDANANGMGLQFSGLVYEDAIGLMAIAAGMEPDRMITTAGSPLAGMSFRAAAQDAVDYMSFAQADATTSNPGSCNRGGWRYSAFDNSGAVGDNSVTQWSTLALEYARHPLYKYEIQLPEFVMTELRDWVTCIQNHGGGQGDGGSGYTGNNEILNAYKTGALVQQSAFLGDNENNVNVQAALAYLSRNWDDTSIGWKRNGTSDYLAMYSIMKGMESMAITDLNGIDWYRQFCDQLKAEQMPDGSWPASQWERDGRLNSTEWALLVLERAAPPPEIIP